MTEPIRPIELAVEVPGTPEEVWWAVATGPGISSWYVPHTVTERAGGAATASFGPGPEMQVHGRVVAWEPPRRVVFDGGTDGVGLTFDWRVEPLDGGRCRVRLLNTGFGGGGEYDAQRDAMEAGWGLFLTNLVLHQEHFAGRTARSVLPMAMWAGPRERAWGELLGGLGLPAAAAVGDRVATSATDAPRLAGTVVDAASWRLALLLDDPAPGTAFLAAEGDGPAVGVSVWSYLYGPEGEIAAARDEPAWWAWLGARALPPASGG